jgi:hypothetical protein
MNIQCLTDIWARSYIYGPCLHKNTTPSCRALLAAFPSSQKGSWTTQQVEKYINKCFGAPHGKGGKTGWQSLERTGQVDLGFKHLGFWI